MMFPKGVGQLYLNNKIGTQSANILGMFPFYVPYIHTLCSFKHKMGTKNGNILGVFPFYVPSNIKWEHA